MQGTTVTSRDLALLHALQLYPRAPWAQLASILATDETTLARRWRYLTEERVAWTTCLPASKREWSTMPSSICSLIEVNCLLGEREAVVTSVSQHRCVVSVDTASGSRDLILTVLLPSAQETDLYVDHVLGAVPGVAAARFHCAGKFFKDGSDWYLDALTDRQQAMLLRAKGQILDVPSRPTSTHIRIIELLSEDVRRPATEIAEQVDRSVSTVSRAIAQLMHAPWVRIRVEPAPQHWGWNVGALLLLRMPPEQAEALGARTQALSAVRMCCSLISRANLAVMVWARGLDELATVEEQLVLGNSEIDIIDRCLLPRSAKRLGHVLDVDGRRIGYVPPSHLRLALTGTVRATV